MDKPDSKPPYKPFGLHLMWDAYNCAPKTLNNFRLVYKTLDKIPEILKMNKLTKPYVVFAEGNGKNDPGGWSGFIIIQESHISIHTFIRKRFVTADIYSCKKFNIKKSVDFFKKTFKPGEVEYKVQTRGRKYPKKNID